MEYAIGWGPPFTALANKGLLRISMAEFTDNF